MAKSFFLARCTVPFAAVLLATFTVVTNAQEDTGETPAGDELLAGHSAHGEAFNEGPRQAAYLMEGTGPIHFEVTSSHPDVQKFVEQGIGQLHGFWYFEAERSFRQAAMLDPDCAIAYWGMAMANTGNSKRAKEFLAKALERRSHATEREAMYIDVLDDDLNGKGDNKEKAKRQIADLERIAERYPNDLEAKAWLGYSLYKNRGNAGKKYEEVDAALNAVLAIEPLHPVHHYRIHLWDYKDAKNALNSASKCGTAAPDIAHMWHMPGHIYSRLNRYEDAVWQQEASARTDHAHMMRDRVLPDEIHNFAHNNEWLIRNLIYVGRWQDAIDLAKNMIELPRHPKYNTLSKRRSSYYGRIRLFDVLERYEQWPELIALTESAYLEPTDDEAEQIRRLQHRGVAFAHLHHVDHVDAVLADLNARLDKEQANAAEADRKHEEAVAKAKEEGKKPPEKPKRSGDDSVKRLEKAIAGIEGTLLVEYGDYKEGLELLKKAGEDKLTLARVQLLAGEKEAALKAVEDEVGKRENQVHALAAQTELLWIAGEKEKAKATFEKLRGLSGSLQFGAAPFDRLAPIAKDLGYPEDWRTAYSHPKDFGQRPELDAIGPFRWSPSPAPTWKLKDHSGKDHSLAEHKGKPVLVIFYLGYACLHCAEQLQAFAPRAKDFEQAGISMVAISTDNMKDLKISVDNYEGGMPFPLLTNAELDVFKAYRAFDDFEQTPLHGTFLINGDGQVLWQDIGYEPFMDVNFALEESQRLLHQEKALPPQLAVVDLPERPQLKPVALADLPRIDPIGIGGSLVLAGSEFPDAAIDQFFRLAHGEAAKAVVLKLDIEDATNSHVERLLAYWNEAGGEEFRVVRVTDERLASADWPQLLSEATGIWIAGVEMSRFEALAKNEAARDALAKFVHDGNVVGAAGDGAAMLAEKAFVGEKSEQLDENTLALLPDAIIDMHAAEHESRSRVEAIIDQQPHRIGYELDPGAAMVVRGRHVWKYGEGTLRIRRHAGGDAPPVEIALTAERDVADLVALRRAARDGLAGYPTDAKPKAAKVDSGTLILIGGGGMPAGIMRRFVDLAGGKEARIVVLPTAMPDPIPEKDGIADEFTKLGAKQVTVLPYRTLDRVESEEFLKTLNEATGIWFGGGRQWRFVDAYLDTKAQEAMHGVLARGGVIMGSSAGASIQAEFLARGNPLGNLDIMADGYQRGLGFLPGAAVDQHFSQRNRQKDMQSLVERYPAWLGIGLDEATALIVHGEVGEVSGRGKVQFFDAASGTKEIKPVIIASGERYDMTRRIPIRPPVPAE